MLVLKHGESGMNFSFIFRPLHDVGVRCGYLFFVTWDERFAPRYLVTVDHGPLRADTLFHCLSGQHGNV